MDNGTCKYQSGHWVRGITFAIVFCSDVLNLNFPLKSLKAESKSLKNTFLKCKVRRKGHSLWSHLQFFKLVPIFPFPIISYHIYYDFYSYKFSVLTSNFILVSWTILAHIFSPVIEGCCRRHSF